ncbi:MAG: hypothetical protein IKE75_03395 [Bacilli bacterium]|nr:hypothetical protein [Bacilli bacterium]
MASRMEKYSNKTSSRSSRNKSLYNNIYTYDSYSNIEGIADIEKNNQVDITKVRELLESRDRYQKQREYRRFSDYKEPETEPIKTRKFPELEEKNYDIRDVLKTAMENKEPDDRERVLRNTQYNILKNIDLKKEVKKEDYYDDPEAELKDLIQTIHENSVLSKQDFTSTDLLSDLKDDDTKVGELDNVKDLIQDSFDEEKIRTRKVNTNNDTNYDRSFFTSSLKLSKSDFDGSGTSGVFSKIIITILIVIMIASAGILVYKLFF